LFASVLLGGPALAAGFEPVSGALQLAVKVTQTTDIAAAQVAIAGPQNVYSVEPLGPATATGEVIARVRTEAVDASWSAAHQIQSWEGHALFDCAGKRVRIIRSASYAQPNLKGEAKVDDLGGAWFAPTPEEPAAVLLAAACDRNFAWPLRAAAVERAVQKTPVAQSSSTSARVAAPDAAPVHEAAASVQNAGFTAAAHERVADAAPHTNAAPSRLAKLAAAPTRAVAGVKRWADAGEGFVSRRASLVRRWFSPRKASPSEIKQAAL
jgi:hypothetical protein